MKLKSFLILLILMFSTGYSFKRFDTTKTFELKDQNWHIYKISGLTQKKDVNGKNYIGLSEISDFQKNDLFIDFEKNSLALENYKILYNSFVLNTVEKFSGNSSGKFTFSDSYIKLLPLETSIFYPGSEVGSFTIEFWLYPYKSYDKQYIVSFFGENINTLERKRNGFAIFIENGKIKYRFENFFFDKQKMNSIEILEIEEEKPLNLYKWEHHAISYDIKNGKLIVFRNGIEEKVLWLTESSKKGGGIYYPYVEKTLNSPIIIGKNSFFLLDNLMFLKDFTTQFNLFPLNKKEAILITKVMKISDNFFNLTDIKLNSKSDNYTFIKLGYRISEKVFSPYDEKIPWIYINKENFISPTSMNSGKYLQLKMLVYPEVAIEDVKICSISVNYNVDENPYTPQIVKIIPKDEKVEIFWIPSPEEDIIGYEIYYGNESKNYICNDSKEGPSPVFVKKQFDGLQIHRATLSLSNEKPYFISLRTIDKNGHKSEYSKEVYVRPSSIYSQNGYSIDR